MTSLLSCDLFLFDFHRRKFFFGGGQLSVHWSHVHNTLKCYPSFDDVDADLNSFCTLKKFTAQLNPLFPSVFRVTRSVMLNCTLSLAFKFSST